VSSEWVFSSKLGLILWDMKLSSGGLLSLILVIPSHQVAWFILVSPSISSSFIISSIIPFPFHHLKHVLSFAYLNFNSVLSLFLYCLFNFAPYLSSFSPYNCVFFLPLWNEHSHLLNHFVKLMSNENFP